MARFRGGVQIIPSFLFPLFMIVCQQTNPKSDTSASPSFNNIQNKNGKSVKKVWCVLEGRNTPADQTHMVSHRSEKCCFCA